MKRPAILSILIFSFILSFGQVVNEDISNTAIYDFLDELATLKVITLNSVIKPYSRSYIAGKLLEAKRLDDLAIRDAQNGNPGPDAKLRLNNRQRKELMFYLQDFQLEKSNEHMAGENSGSANGNPPDSGSFAKGYDHQLKAVSANVKGLVLAWNPLGFHYQDKLLTLSLRPIIGYTYMAGNNNQSVYHRWWGGSMSGYIGKHFGFYANLRDNTESEPMALPKYFTQEQGAVYKYNSNGSVDFSEMKGGITYSWNWGSFGLMKDRLEWGNNYHGANILSGKAPSFPYIHLHINPVKWFDFNYIHAWLNSNVIDSSRSYYSGNVYRVIYRNKFMAANMFTVTPWRGLNLSLGNSIIYSDNGVQPVFLIPFLFYNSVDATESSYDNDAGQNSQFFIDISSRQIRHLSMYVTLFIDELMMSRVFDPNTLNWTSWKVGFKLSDFPFRNVSLTGEWTKTNPITYKHYISTTTFASNDYTMGHYLRDNSMEIYGALSFKPYRGLTFNLDYVLAMHGDEYPDDRSYNYDILRFMQNKTWQQQSVGLSARYEFVNNGYFFIRYLYSNQEYETSYVPAIMAGKTQSISVGLNIGF